jgi:hypothetical protein
MSDKDYIEGLEYLVSSFASAYQVNFEKFYWKNYEICDASSPDRRDLTEIEKDVLMRFTTYQGRFRDKVKAISKLEKEQPSELNKIIERLLK